MPSADPDDAAPDEPDVVGAVRRHARPLVALGLVLAGAGGAGIGFGGTAVVVTAPTATSAATVAVLVVGVVLLAAAGLVWTVVWPLVHDTGLTWPLSAALLAGGTATMIAAAIPTATPTDDGVAPAIGAVLVACGTVGVVGSVVGRRRERAAAAIEDEVVRTGVRTVAIVTDQGYERFGRRTYRFAPVTVMFLDGEGEPRLVTVRVLMHVDDPIVEGQRTALWYDPASPGDVRRIVVEAERSRRDGG